MACKSPGAGSIKLYISASWLFLCTPRRWSLIINPTREIESVSDFFWFLRAPAYPCTLEKRPLHLPTCLRVVLRSRVHFISKWTFWGQSVPFCQPASSKKTGKGENDTHIRFSLFLTFNPFSFNVRTHDQFPQQGHQVAREDRCKQATFQFSSVQFNSVQFSCIVLYSSS